MDFPRQHEAENNAYSSKSDEELIQICPDNRDAFGELARRYRPMAFRAAFCVLRNELDAEDQVQTAFCKAFDHIGQFRRSAKFSTWLMRIVVNECLMQLRQRRRISLISLDSSGSDARAWLALSDGSSPEKRVLQRSLARLLEREIRRIPPLLRHAFVLRDVQEKPMAEVARRLGISVEASKSRLARAREELRKKLEPQLTAKGARMESNSTNTRKETA
ncbi:MAG TPA: sigma-70 family RNA polymerase sigma factor [Bryobacteraceae bacterium]|jgi:RNA polymerase sigma-70 factor (ECF subfamily)|nr:sigma-70 family RNA polymerase sigma factor [Bryobacteraceae bacterium]